MFSAFLSSSKMHSPSAPKLYARVAVKAQGEYLQAT